MRTNGMARSGVRALLVWTLTITAAQMTRGDAAPAQAPGPSPGSSLKAAPITRTEATSGATPAELGLSAAAAASEATFAVDCTGKPDFTPCSCSDGYDGWCYTIYCQAGRCQHAYNDPLCEPPDDCSYAICRASAPDPAPFCSFWCDIRWAAAPPIFTTLTATKSVETIILSWPRIRCCVYYDVVRGSLSALQATQGDFTASTQSCASRHQWQLSFADPAPPQAGEGFWYLVRGFNGAYPGTYEEGGQGQVGARDAEINASPASCP